MDKIRDKFLKATRASFIAYNKKGGARSNKKLIPIHKFLSETILKKLEGVLQEKRTARLGGFIVFWDGKNLSPRCKISKKRKMYSDFWQTNRIHNRNPFGNYRNFP